MVDFLKFGLPEVGVKETPGPEHSPRVLQYFDRAGHGWVKDDETAWCAAYVGWVIEQAGGLSTKMLNARSYLDWGVKSHGELGDVVVLWRIKPESAWGHVGFLIASRDGFVYLLGGNQSNEVNIMAYPSSRVLGYRKPF